MPRRNIRWTIEAVQKDAKQYKHRVDWQKASPGAYSSARAKNILAQCCAHMVPKPRIIAVKWTTEAIQEDAMQYKHRIDWQKASPGAYNAARANNILDQCCAHMLPKPRPMKWTKAACARNALRFSTRTSWAQQNPQAYETARKKGWLEDCCSHMTRNYNQHKKRDKYQQPPTKQSCIAAARRYTRRIDWQNNDIRTYRFARNNGWLDECCEHMKPILQYWTLETCLESAQKYSTASEWKALDRKAYEAASRNNWMNKCTSHMVRKIKWTKSAVIADASRFDRREDWSYLSPSTYNAARRNGWLNECTQHMTLTSKRWTRLRCIADSAKYTSEEEWKKANLSAFVAAHKRGWLSECFS